jgi:hypothetical protein
MSRNDLFIYSSVFEDFQIKNLFNKISENKSTQFATRFLFDIICEMDGRYSKKEIIESIRQNLYLLRSDKLKTINYKKNDIEIKLNDGNKAKHPESVIEYFILRNNVVLGTFGFFLTVTNGNNILRISNIQGIRNNSLSKDVYNILNKELRENWRVFVVKKIIDFSKKNNFQIVLELPKKAEANKSEYIRQIRQYLQTAKKAGLQFSQISIKGINDPEIREKFISFLKNKIEKPKKVIDKKKVVKKKKFLNKKKL